jgi:hypothetical protein
MQRIYYILISIVLLNSILQAQVLQVPQCWQETNWCWCASSQAILEYYGVTKSLAEIAQYGTEGEHITNYLWGTRVLPTRRGVAEILNHFGNILCDPLGQSLAYETVAFEISKRRPIPILWMWSSGLGHILVIHGAVDSLLYIMDPYWGKSINTYDWVKQGGISYEFSGSEHSWTRTLKMLTTPTIVQVKLKVFLEGPYKASATSMNNTGIIYNPYWGSYCPTNAVDLINIEIRNTPTSTSQTSHPAWLMVDGSIKSTIDTSAAYLEFNALAESYYIVVRHRNHIAAMSAGPVAFNDSCTFYDFTTGIDKYYGNDAKQLTNGLYGMYAGDVDTNGVVNNLDKDATWNNRNLKGYLPADLDLSGVVDALDRNIPWNNRNVQTHVP